MKVAIITDQHFGFKKGSKLYLDYFQKFYDEVFFPTLEREGITTILDLGDTFDNRKGVDSHSLDWAKKHYFDPIHLRGIRMVSIIGNHTAYYKNTNEINTNGLVLREYDNITLLVECEELEIGGLNILFIPWINQENEASTYKKIKESKAKVAMGHLELNGFTATHGHVMENGADFEIYNKFKQVFSGHYHTRSNNGTIYYLGNPYEMFWNDVNDTRGFHLFDTKTIEHTPINNPYRLFYNIYYEDTNYKLFDTREYKDKIVKVVVKKKTDQKQFEKFIDKLYNSGIQDLKIIENFVLTESADFEVEETENTIGILNRYIDESEFEGDKALIKGILQQIYTEACEVD